MAALIRNVVLNPLVTGPLLILFTVGPQQVREPILDSLKSYSYYRPVERGLLALKWLFGLGLAGSVHGFLSELGQNNFRLRSEKHRYDWPNEIAVVTGAASGFGRLISEGLAAKGIRVMALDLHDSLPADMPPNEKINYYKCDITSAEAVNAVADAIRSDYGNPSILVNNAGIAFDTSIMATSPEKLRRIFDVNTLSHYFTVQALLPSMVKQRKGHIVTMASMASFLSGPTFHDRGMVHYCMTKSAALTFHEGLAAELRTNRLGFAAPEIKLTCVHPTWAATPMIAPHRSNIDKTGMTVINPQLVADAVVNQILSGRGRQILLSGGMDFLSTMRAWPSWITGGIGAVLSYFDN